MIFTELTTEQATIPWKVRMPGDFPDTRVVYGPGQRTYAACAWLTEDEMDWLSTSETKTFVAHLGDRTFILHNVRLPHRGVEVSRILPRRTYCNLSVGRAVPVT